MRSAFYYPHTEIRSTELLKTCLLLWDRLGFIVPDSGYKPSYSDHEVAEAVELIGFQHVPTSEEQREAHEKLEDLATRRLPETFYYRLASHESSPYEIYPQKLSPETWEMLRAAQLAGAPLANADYPLAVGAGLSVMSILADSCAGETHARVTDRGEAYGTITNLLVENADPQKSHEAVVPVTLRAIGTSKLSLRSLIEFRKRESTAAGADYRDLRHRYADCLESHIHALRTISKPGDVEELQRQFEEKMRDDVRHLRAELGLARTEAMFSKDVVATVVTTVLSGVAVAANALFGAHLTIPAAVVGAAGGLVTVGGILGTRSKLAAARRATMQKHPMAYLYELV